MRVADREIGEHGLHAEAAHRFAERVIVGELVLDRLETADRFKRRAAQGDGGADARPRHFQRHAGNDIWQEAVIDAHGAEAGPQTGHGQAAIEAGDKADAGLGQGIGQFAKIIGRDDDVAVGENHHVMSDMAREVDEIRDLAIGPVQVGIDDQRRGQADRRAVDPSGAKVADNFPRHKGGGVGFVVDAEQDLHRTGVSLSAKAREVLVEALFGAIERLEHGDPGGKRPAAFILARKTPQAEDRDQRIKAGGDRHAVE